MTAAAQLRSVSVRYPDGRGLRDISATLQPGRAVALIGPSGAGKSTLLQVVAGEVRPDAGAAQTLGQPLAQLRGAAYRHACARVGVMPQADDLTPGLSVLHNVFVGRLSQWSTARALRNRLWPRASDRAAVRAALDAVELADRIDARPEELSGGERRRVALARLAFQAPQLWLADEPTTGLDVRLRADVIGRLLALVRDAGAATMVALHDLELLHAGFDEVWGLRGGTLVFQREADAVSSGDLEALFEGER